MLSMATLGRLRQGDPQKLLPSLPNLLGKDKGKDFFLKTKQTKKKNPNQIKTKKQINKKSKWITFEKQQ